MRLLGEDLPYITLEDFPCKRVSLALKNACTLPSQSDLGGEGSSRDFMGHALGEGSSGIMILASSLDQELGTR